MEQVQVELERFRVKKGKETVAQEWMTFLNDHLEEVLQTLPGEKMYVESIFEEVVDETMYLYWVYYQGMAASDVVFSDFHVDQKHLAYWSECIDPSYGEHLLKTKVVMIQDKVKNEMQD